jgi:acetyltransferase-like isoleucine patch superfamily enzyme
MPGRAGGVSRAISLESPPATSIWPPELPINEGSGLHPIHSLALCSGSRFLPGQRVRVRTGSVVGGIVNALASLRFARQRWRELRGESQVRGSVLARFPTTVLAPNVEIKSPERLALGAGVVIQRNSIVHCGGMASSHGAGSVVLEDHVIVGPGCILYGTDRIVLGANTHLGPGVKVLCQAGDTRQRAEEGGGRFDEELALVFEPVVVGRGCWLGAGSVLLGGTMLGDGCTVGPNAVVKGRYPDHTCLIGNPARPSLSLSKRSHAEDKEKRPVPRVES